jgi:membrane-associated phospholipid phosphatase
VPRCRLPSTVLHGFSWHQKSDSQGVIEVADMAGPVQHKPGGKGTHSSAASISPHRGFLVLIMVFLGFVVAMALDRAVYLHLQVQAAEPQDWYRVLRVGGYLPYWLLVALAWMLLDASAIKTFGVRRALARGILLSTSVVTCGILAEVLKVLMRRERPGLHDGYYFFRPWSAGLLDTSGLGLPSSHAAVAFAATWVLCFLYPRALPVWLLVGMGCGVSRILDRAHFLSDVYLAAVFSFFWVRVLWRWFADDLSAPGGAALPWGTGDQ